jgi:hypothetical protein
MRQLIAGFLGVAAILLIDTAQGEGIGPPASASIPISEARPGCCKVCHLGCACGDSCIDCSKTCTKGPGCACDE